MRGDLAEEAEGPRLVAALTALAGEPQGALGARAGVLDRLREQIRLAELHEADRVEVSDPAGVRGGQGLLQPGDALRRRVPTRAYTCPSDAIAFGSKSVMLHSRH